MRNLTNWYVLDSQKHAERLKGADFLRIRGTGRKPFNPRDVFAQSGPRGLLVTWKLPEHNFSDIAGWRVYKDDENTLYAEVRDRGTRTHFIETTAGTTSPSVNVFVSAVNSMGRESSKIQVQGKAITEAGAPVMPGPPPGYTGENSGGGNRSSGIGIKRELL